MANIDFVMEYVWYSIGAAAIVFPWYIFSSTLDRLPKRQKKTKHTAIDRGHVVEAVFVRSYYGDRDDPSKEMQCLYEYHVNGRKYHYTVFDNNPAPTLTLYYVRSPRKAAMADAINASEKHWFARYLIVLAVILLVAKVLIYVF